MSPSVGALAYELAAGLTERREILARYSVTIPAFRVLVAHPVFQDMLRRAKAEFASLASTPDRVRLKAQLLTELGLMEMWGIVRSVRAPEAARVSAYNSIKALTGMDRPEEATPLQKFSLKINITNASPSEPVVVIQGSKPDDQATAPAPAPYDPPVIRAGEATIRERVRRLAPAFSAAMVGPAPG